MNIEAISSIGLALCLAPAAVHAVEVIKPIWVRWVVNVVLPLFTPGLPRKKNYITEKEQLTMLDAALDLSSPDPDHKRSSQTRFHDSLDRGKLDIASSPLNARDVALFRTGSRRKFVLCEIGFNPRLPEHDPQTESQRRSVEAIARIRTNGTILLIK